MSYGNVLIAIYLHKNVLRKKCGVLKITITKKLFVSQFIYGILFIRWLANWRLANSMTDGADTKWQDMTIPLVIICLEVNFLFSTQLAWETLVSAWENKRWTVYYFYRVYIHLFIIFVVHFHNNVLNMLATWHSDERKKYIFITQWPTTVDW